MITSIHNPRIQAVRALLARRKERIAQGQFVVEGVRLAEEAFQAGWLPELVLVAPQLSERGRSLVEEFSRRGIEVEETSAELLSSLADTEAPQGLLAVVRARLLPVPVDLDFLLIVDAVRDPGNLGTILRSALAAGVQAVFLTPGTVDEFSPKVLRAGMGAQFHLPVRQAGWDEIQAICRQRAAPLRLLLSEAGQGIPLWQTDLCQPVALVVGGEAEGASPAARSQADGFITVPMPGQVESLNAAVAASIILFEVVRQRSQRNRSKV
jgi:TrmH family RNA methyltransferase